MKIKQLFHKLSNWIIGPAVVAEFEDLIGHMVAQVDLNNYFIRIYHQNVIHPRFGIDRSYRYYKVSRFNGTKTYTFRVLDESGRDILNPSAELIVRNYFIHELHEAGRDNVKLGVMNSMTIERGVKVTA